MIAFQSVTKRYGNRTVLDDVSFQIQPGEFVCLTGPSGAGKSTILNLLIRAELVTDGCIEVDGADLAELPRGILQMYRQRTGVLFQDYKLLADRTVFENVAFAMEVCDAADEEIAPRVLEILERLKLSDRKDAFPCELSGGEKTRAALARALANRPSILLADEPTGNIDPDQSMEILQILKEVNAEGTTVILASHDQRVVDSLGVRVIRLEQGKVVRNSIGGYLTEAARDLAPIAAESVAEPTVQVATVPHPYPVHHAHAHKAKDEGDKSHGTGKIKPIAI